VISDLNPSIDRKALLRATGLTGVGLIAAALIGCGGADDADKDLTSSASGTAAAGASAVALPGLDVGGRRIPYNFPEPAGKTPREGGNLVVAVTWEPTILDTTKSVVGGGVTIPNTVYDRLLGFKRGPEADPYKLEIVPELATSWDASPDGLTYTFKLKQGVKWQNVAPLNARAFTATDAKFAYERYKTEGVNTSYFTNVKSIDAVDDHTLRISLNKPQPDFLIPIAGRYTTIFPKELVDDGTIAKRVIGTGPMILKDLNSSSIKFDANPDYWAGKPHIAGMEYRVMVDATAQLAAFRTGQLDLGVSVATGASELQELLKTNPEVQATATAPVNITFSVGFNLDKPIYKDERVRRAFSLAMDRDEIMATVGQGYGYVLPNLPWPFVFDKEPTVESGVFGKWWRTDRAEAKQLLAAAGASDLSINMLYYNYGDSSNGLPNEMLVNQYRQVGIKVQLSKVDYTEYTAQLTGASFPDVMDAWGAHGFDADNFFYNHLKSDSPGNRWRIKDTQIDQWADQQHTEVNPQARREILRKIWDRMQDMMYKIEKPAVYGFAAYQPWVRNFRSVGPLSANNTYYDIGAQVKNLWIDK
jgi:peptide/nickel transport system substrate-binding protein